jgi:abhydrolase domain-containing protein 17
MGDTVSSLLFQPPPPTKLKEEKIIWLNTKKGKRIPAFYIQHKTSNGTETARSLTLEELKSPGACQGITILYSHANAEDLGSIYPWCKFLCKMLRVNLFAYDYCGYGMAFEEGKWRRGHGYHFAWASVFPGIVNWYSLFQNTDSPSEDNCYADIEAAYDFLRNSLRIPNQNIVLYGRSLGSGPSCHLTAGTALSEDGPVGGLILHAPFMSVYRIVVDTGCTVFGDKFPNVDYAPMINSPVLLIHGTNDQIVPFYHSEKIYQALKPECRSRPLYIDGMGHNNVHSAVRPMFVDRVCEYLDRHILPFAITLDTKSEGKRAIGKKVIQMRLPSFRKKMASESLSDGSSGLATPLRA